MPTAKDTVLHEDVEVFEVAPITRSASRALPEVHGTAGALCTSPDGAALAIVDCTCTSLTVLHCQPEDAVQGASTGGDGNAVEAHGPCAPDVRCFRATFLGPRSMAQEDVLVACCWATDSSRIAAAYASGHLYVLNRDAQLLHMVEPSSCLWRGQRLVGVALPRPNVLLALTHAPPQLYVVPLAQLPPRALAALKPLQLAKSHACARALSYDARSGFVAVAGDAAGGAGGQVSVTVWKLELPQQPDAASQQPPPRGPPGRGPPGPPPPALGPASEHLRHVGAFVGPSAAPGKAQGKAVLPAGLSRWGISFSPLSEHLAVACPPAGGLVLLSLPQCKRLDPMAQFAGRAAPPTSALEASLAGSLARAESASWWSLEHLLALSDETGTVGLARLPGCTDALSGAAMQRFPKGTRVACKVVGPSPKGIWVLEPVEPEGGASSSTSRAEEGAKRRGGGPAPSRLHVPGWRLTLLAERTPEEMMQVHMREQSWGEAFEVARTYGLDPDVVYRARWASRPVDTANIQDNLSKMANRRWVGEECCRRLARDYEGQRKLLNYGLRETARQAKPQGLEGDDESQASGGSRATGLDEAGEGQDPSGLVWWRGLRLRLWRYSDRLEVLYAAQGRTFDPEAYAGFRELPVAQAACSWAAVGAVGSLGTLLQYYPASLAGPVLLGVLEQLPETLNPRLYSSMLPKADGSLPAPSRPMRKLDWSEAKEVASELLTSARQLGMEEAVDPEATDELVRVLSPRPRLAPAAVAEWYAKRALTIDDVVGQLYGAQCLLEVAAERGVTAGRLPQLLRAAKALAGVVCATGPVPHTRGAAKPAWLLSLSEFAALPARKQLRLLLQGSRTETLQQDLEACVLPFVEGMDGGEVSELLGGMISDELDRRPEWCAALVGLEAQRPRVYSSPEALAQAVTRAVTECSHTDQWQVLQGMVTAVDEMLDKQLKAAHEQEAPSQGEAASKAASDRVHALECAQAGLGDLKGFVRAGSLLAAHGLPLTVRHISQCGREEAARCLRQLLGRVQRTSSGWSDSDWSALWRDLKAIREGAFPFLEPEDLLAELCRCLLHSGRLALASNYLRGTGSVQLDAARADALVASVAHEVLASANDLCDPAVQLAGDVLALAPHAPDAAALAALVTALQLLPLMGVELRPAQVLQMPDRIEVIRMVLEESLEEWEAAEGAGSTKPASGGVGAGGGAGKVGFSSGLGIRRRTAAGLKAGRTAASALAGGLLAVAGKVAPSMAERVMAPVAGMVADAVTNAVSGAAAAATAVAAAASAAHTGAPMFRQLGRLLELAELLGLKGEADELRVKALAADAAYRAGDLQTAQQLAMPLVAARHAPAWPLCADLGSDKRLAAVPAADDACRQRLLSFALAHCPPGRLTRLLEELLACERRMAAAADPAGIAECTGAPQAVLRKALLEPLAEPPTATLPSLGDVPLAVTTLMAQPNAAAAGQLLDSVVGAVAAAGQQGNGSVADVGGSLPYAQLQRVLAVGCYSHCLRVLMPKAGGDKHIGAAAMKVLQAPLSALLDKVRKLKDSGLSAAQQQAKAAAMEYAARLSAARDSRAMRQHLPNVDAAQFCSGDSSYRNKVILEQASLAGQQAAHALASGAAASSAEVKAAAKLLEDARGLAAAYGIDAWLVALHYTCALVSSAPSVTNELKQAVQQEEPLLLMRPDSLLRHLAATTYPALPPTSGHHLALFLGVTTDCLHALAKAAASGSSVSVITPQLDKLRDLLDKAAPALKGLALTAVHASLLAAALAPLGAELAGPPQAGGGEAAAAPAAPPQAALALGAQRALYSYAKPTNVAQAAKLVKALHAIFAPTSSRKGSMTPPPAAKADVVLAAALAALAPSLPYLCLVTKAACYKVPAGAGAADAAAPPPRDMDSTMAHITEHLPRLTSPELAAWLRFAMLQGPCPLDPKVTDGTVLPYPLSPDHKLVLLESSLPRLQGQEQGPAGEQAGAAATVGDAGALQELSALHRRLCALRAVRQASSLTEDQVSALEQQLTQAGSGASIDSILAQLAGSGCSVHVLLDIAAASASDGAAAATDDASSSSSALPAVSAAVSAAVSGALHQLQAAIAAPAPATRSSGAGASTASQGRGPAPAGSGLPQLEGVLKCLDARDVSASGSGGPAVPPPSPGGAAAAASGRHQAEVQALRDGVWGQLQAFTDGQAAEQFSQPLVARLLDLQAGLGTPTMWADWVGHGTDRQQQQLRLLFGRTCSLLASGSWPASSMPLQHDVADLPAAQACFQGLLAHCDQGSSPGGSGASGRQQLHLLAQLLNGVWRNGDAWASGSAGGAGEAAAPAGVSPLHSSWLALMRAMVESGHVTDVLRLLDSVTGSTHPLAQEELGTLAAVACNAPAGGIAAAWVVRLLSPHATQREEALAEIKQWRLDAVSGGCETADDAALLGGAADPEVLCSLLALLLSSGAAGELAASPVLLQLLQPLWSALPHPSLHHFGALGRAPGSNTVGAETVNAGTSALAELRGCLLPCLVASLCERHHHATAAGIVSQRLRLHSTLNALGAGLMVLDRYLHACCNSSWQAPVAGTEHVGAALAGVPSAYQRLLGDVTHACKRAMHALSADAR